MSAGLVFAAIIGVLAAGSLPAASSPHPCLEALAPLAEGAAPLSASFSLADCPDRWAAAAFHHDAVRGVSLASRAIAAGEIVPAYPEYGADMVMPGQTLHLIVRLGAASIDREVEALQAARPGQRLFVKDADGQVISARYGRSAR